MRTRIESMEHVYDDLYAKLYDIPFGLIFRHGRKRTIELMDIKPNQTILEIGVGTGLMLPMYPENIEVIGIDISQDMMEGAIKRSRKKGLSNVRFSIQDATKLAFKDNTFDRIAAPYVMSVVPDPVETFHEMVRVCKPDGRIVFINHFQSEKGPLNSVIAKANKWFVKVGFRTDLKLNDLLKLDLVEVDHIEGVNLFDWWQLVSCRPKANGVIKTKTNGTQ